jgi:antitoxin StbD
MKSIPTGGAMTSTNAIYASSSVTITELKRDPNAVIEEAGRSDVAILRNKRPSAYLVSAKRFEALIDKLEDLELAAIARQRRGGKTIKVSLDEL